MTQWGPPAHQMQYPTSLSQSGRGSWDYAYLNASAAAGVPSAAQPLQRPDLTADMNQISADTAYHQYGERTTRV
jgi:hypothetical protein